MHVYMRANSPYVTCMHINMSSPKPYYYEQIGAEYHLFEGGEPSVFRTYSDMEHYLLSGGFGFELIKVDYENWQQLADSGVFDCDF